MLRKAVSDRYEWVQPRRWAVAARVFFTAYDVAGGHTVMQATEMGRWVPELANLTTADTPAYMYVIKY